MPLAKDIHLRRFLVAAAMCWAGIQASAGLASANECAATAADLMAEASKSTAEARTKAELKFVIEAAVRRQSLGDEMGCLSQLAEVREKISTQ
jgi:hypothetical protein